jgi:uncharacterized lipoprotein YehR (DUF1307 family)
MNNNFCLICNKKFSSKQSYQIHLKSELHIKNFIDNHNFSQQLLLEKDKIIKEKDDNICDLKKTISELKNENFELKIFFKNNIYRLTESIRAISYATLFFKNAPNISTINLNLYKDKQKFIYDLIDSYEQKKLITFIGNIFVENYKKEKSEEQSIWAVDISRTTFIYKNDNLWKKDKGNVFLINNIISNGKKQIKNILTNYLFEISTNLQNHTGIIEKDIYKDFNSSNNIIVEFDKDYFDISLVKNINPQILICYE